MSLLEIVIIILMFIVVIGVMNERIFHMQSDIALVFFSLIFSAVVLILQQIPGISHYAGFLQKLGEFGFEEYLLDCVLCYMLFAGASKVNMLKFRQNIKTISLLALAATVISSGVYGLLFWLLSRMFLPTMDIWMCILLGCIVSPTDPIAATGILNKLGLSKNVTSVIENESLFNDGTGVALFVFVKSIVSQSGKSNFLVVMLKEILGALAVAFVISYIMFRLVKLTKDPMKQLLISFLNVSLVYAICEHFGFSGVIASVVCGMYFAAQMHDIKRKRLVQDPDNLYHDFWETVDTILNAVLFVMIGISVLTIEFSSHIWILLPAAVLCVIASRFVGVAAATLCAGKEKIPSSYSLGEFLILMTWSALKGGLSLALAMGTRAFLPEEIYLVVLNTTYITIFFTVIGQGLTIKSGYAAIEKHKAKRIHQQSRRA